MQRSRKYIVALMAVIGASGSVVGILAGQRAEASQRQPEGHYRCASPSSCGAGSYTCRVSCGDACHCTMT